MLKIELSNGTLNVSKYNPGESDYNLKILQNLINYDEVSKKNYPDASTTITALDKNFESKDSLKFYDRVINATSRDELVNMLYEYLKASTESAKQKEYNKKYNTFRVYAFKFDEYYERNKKNIETSLDTSIYYMVSRILSAYCRYNIDNLLSNPSVAPDIIKCYTESDEDIANRFYFVRKVTDPDIRSFLITKIKSILRKRDQKTDSMHLCGNCPVDIKNCPKLKAPWGKKITDFDFIEEGYEIDYEPGDKREKIQYSKDEEIEDETVIYSTMVRNLIVTKCALEEAERKRREELGNSKNVKKRTLNNNNRNNN